LLSQWLLEEPSNPIPYQLREVLEREMRDRAAVLAFVLRWCSDLCWPRIPALNEIRKQGEHLLAKAFLCATPLRK
jgi:hypothetical protein